MSNRLRISNLYGPVIANECSLTGQLSYGVKLAEKEEKYNYLTPGEIIDHLVLKGVRYGSLVIINGNDPCRFDLDDLCRRFHGYGIRIALETRGIVYKNWIKRCDIVICTPDSQERIHHDTLNWYVGNLVNKLILKFHIQEDHDLDFIEKFIFFCPEVPCYGYTDYYKYTDITSKIMKRPKLHRIILPPPPHVNLQEAS